jgi:hypothetical protein
VFGEDARHSGFGEFGGAGRRGSGFEQRPKPWLGSRFRQLEQLREEAVKLVAGGWRCG